MSSSASSGWATSSSSSMQSLLLSSFFPSLGWRHPSVYNFHRHNLTIVIYPHFQVLILISWWSLSISRWWSLSLIRITTWKWGFGDGWQLWRLYQVVILTHFQVVILISVTFTVTVIVKHYKPNLCRCSSFIVVTSLPCCNDITCNGYW